MLDAKLQLKAKWVAEMMAADGVTADQVTPDLALSYMHAITRKIEQIQSTYLTRNGAREAMQKTVLNMIKVPQ